MTSPAPELVVGDDGLARCAWCMNTPGYIAYHDDEWGRRVADDARLFEKICLEGFQAGLSWLTILRKRENFRRAFRGFEIAQVARFGERDVERLLGDAGIIRHRGKIEATINNARRAAELLDEFGSMIAYVDQWRPVDPPPPPVSYADVPAQTDLSKAMSKDLKKRGWRFVGPTTAYAFMQAMGVVNDHLAGCAIRERASRPTDSA